MRKDVVENPFKKHETQSFCLRIEVVASVAAHKMPQKLKGRSLFFA